MRGMQPPQLPLLCSYPLCSFVQSPTLPSCSFVPPRAFVPSCAHLYSLHSPRARLYHPRCSVHTPCACSNPRPPLVLARLLVSFVPSPGLRSYPLRSFEPSHACLYSPHSPRARSFSFVLSLGLRSYPLHTFILPPGFPSLLPLPLLLPLHVCIRWLSGPCAPALHLPSC